MSFFDKGAATWDEDPSKIERANLLARGISDSGSGRDWKKGLEFGAGTGLVSFFLKDQFEQITLADSSPGMIQVLKEKIESSGIKNFHPLLLESMNGLPENEFDLVYSLMALHHVEDLDGAFVNFRRTLKKEGFLAIADLVKEDGDFHGSPSMEGMRVHHGFDREELVERLGRHHFQTIEYRIFYTITRQDGESSAKKEYPLFLLIAQSVDGST